VLANRVVTNLVFRRLGFSLLPQPSQLTVNGQPTVVYVGVQVGSERPSRREATNWKLAQAFRRETKTPSSKIFFPFANVVVLLAKFGCTRVHVIENLEHLSWLEGCIESQARVRIFRILVSKS